MKLSIAGKYRTLVAALDGDLDHHSAENLRERIDRELNRTGAVNIAFDFSRVSFMDSSGIGLILARYRFCQNTGTSLYVEGVNRQTQKILALAGIKTINDVAI